MKYLRKSRSFALIGALCGLVGMQDASAIHTIVSPYLVAMMAGPVGDGPSVILVKKRENFLSWETPLIACTAGFTAGAMAAGLPAAAALMTTGATLAPVSASYLIGYGIYGCVVSAVGGAVGVATEMALTPEEAVDGIAPEALPADVATEETP